MASRNPERAEGCPRYLLDRAPPARLGIRVRPRLRPLWSSAHAQPPPASPVRVRLRPDACAPRRRAAAQQAAAAAETGDAQDRRRRLDLPLPVARLPHLRPLPRRLPARRPNALPRL